MEGHTPAVTIESAAEESNQTAVADGNITAIVKRSVKRTRELFAEDQENIYSTPSEDQLRYASCESFTARFIRKGAVDRSGQVILTDQFFSLL